MSSDTHGTSLQVCSRSLVSTFYVHMCCALVAKHPGSSSPHTSILTQWNFSTYTHRMYNSWPRMWDVWELASFGGASNWTIAGAANGFGSGIHWKSWASFSVPYRPGSTCQYQKFQISTISAHGTVDWQISATQPSTLCTDLPDTGGHARFPITQLGTLCIVILISVLPSPLAGGNPTLAAYSNPLLSRIYIISLWGLEPAMMRSYGHRPLQPLRVHYQTTVSLSL